MTLIWRTRMAVSRNDKLAAQCLIERVRFHVQPLPEPTDLRGWIRAAHTLGLETRSEYAPTSPFAARLRESRVGDFEVIYNSGHRLTLKVRYVIHEIAEYLQIDEDAQLRLFGELHEPFYDGGSFPADIRHRRAMLVTDLLAPLPSKGPPKRLQVFDWKRYGRQRVEIEYIPVELLDTLEWQTFGRCAE